MYLDLFIPSRGYALGKKSLMTVDGKAAGLDRQPAPETTTVRYVASDKYMKSRRWEAVPMKLLAVVSSTGLFLLLGITAPVDAHQEQPAKPPKQEQQAKPEQQRQQQDRSARQEQQQQSKGQQDEQRQQRQQRQEQDRSARQEQQQQSKGQQHEQRQQ